MEDDAITDEAPRWQQLHHDEMRGVVTDVDVVAGTCRFFCEADVGSVPAAITEPHQFVIVGTPVDPWAWPVEPTMFDEVKGAATEIHATGLTHPTYRAEE